MAELVLDVALERGSFALAVRETIDLAGITALFGPSGSGKTTLLRIISGLETAADGDVTFDGERWQASGVHVPPHKRRVGYVFQDGRLFAHLTVAKNLAFGFGRRAERERAAIRFDDVVAALDLAPLLSRRPASLSGGEQQRVAIGRALLAGPRLLLMDEPMSSLDVRRKAEILPYIERLPEAFGLPVLYVTHSVDEVARLASSVVLLSDGQVVGRGLVAEILERIDLWPVTGRLDAGTLVETVVDDARAGMASLVLGRQRLRVPLAGTPVGTKIRLRILARDVAIATEKPRAISIRNVLEAEILSVDFYGPVYVELLLDVDGRHLRSRITREAFDELGLDVGRRVYALIKSVAFEDRGVGDAAGV
ncbi:MAG TPA: molybdenum ABC transporter ATP-binding protein [Gammaproteobacteria bacterium]